MPDVSRLPALDWVCLSWVHLRLHVFVVGVMRVKRSKIAVAQSTGTLVGF